MPVPVSIDGEVSFVGADTKGVKLDLSKNSHLIIDPAMWVLRKLPIIGECEENLEKRKKR